MISRDIERLAKGLAYDTNTKAEVLLTGKALLLQVEGLRRMEHELAELRKVCHDAGIRRGLAGGNESECWVAEYFIHGRPSVYLPLPEWLEQRQKAARVLACLLDTDTMVSRYDDADTKRKEG